MKRTALKRAALPPSRARTKQWTGGAITPRAPAAPTAQRALAVAPLAEGAKRRVVEKVSERKSQGRTVAAGRYLAKVAALGCIACSLLGLGYAEPAIHHIREGRIARCDWLVLPLCPPHHVGSRMSVHMDKAPLMRALGVASEFDLLAVVLERLGSH